MYRKVNVCMQALSITFTNQNVEDCKRAQNRINMKKVIEVCCKDFSIFSSDFKRWANPVNILNLVMGKNDTFSTGKMLILSNSFWQCAERQLRQK